MRQAISRRPFACLVLSSFILLAACGGGGGGNGSGSGPIDSEPPLPLPPPAREAAWSATPIQIDSPAASGAAARPTLVSDAAGNVTAAWTQVQDGRIGIGSSTYHAATALWSAPVALEDPDAGDAGRPALAVDAAGNATLLWSQAKTQELSTVYARRYDATQGRWSASEQVRTGVKAVNPVLVVEAAGSLTAAWHEQHPDSGLLGVVSSRFHQGSWSAPAQLSSPDAFGILGDPVLAVAAGGMVVAAWAEEPLTGLSFITINASRFDGATWSPPVRIDTPIMSEFGVFSHAPALAADGGGNVTAAWIQDDLAGVFVVTSRFDGEAWSTPTRISSDSPSVGMGNVVRLGADSAGNVTAVWEQFTHEDGHHLSSSRFSALSGGWGTPVQISHAGTGLEQAPTFSLAAQADGNLVAAWTASTNRSIIVSSRYVAALDRWDTPQQIDGPAAAGDATSPVVTLDGAGKATAAWVQVQGGRAVINANRFE